MALQLTVKRVEGQKVFYTNGKGNFEYTKNVSKTPFLTHRGNQYKFDSNTQTFNLVDMETSSPLTPLETLPEFKQEFSINKRFAFLEKFTTMVLYGITPSLLLCGEGGLGKSHTVMNQIYKENLEEDVDYKVIKGYSTPKALYATLYENRKKILIFDDCDSILTDAISLNILKGAIDSYKKRTVSWLEKGFVKSDVPPSFDFEGQIIFISNKSLKKIDGAVKSRTLSIDLTMTVQDKIDRMTEILPDILPEYNIRIKQEVLSFIDDYKYEATELNLRTLEKLIRVHAGYDDNIVWKEAAKYLLVQH